MRADKDNSGDLGDPDSPMVFPKGNVLKWDLLTEYKESEGAGENGYTHVHVHDEHEHEHEHDLGLHKHKHGDHGHKHSHDHHGHDHSHDHHGHDHSHDHHGHKHSHDHHGHDHSHDHHGHDHGHGHSCVHDDEDPDVGHSHVLFFHAHGLKRHRKSPVPKLTVALLLYVLMVCAILIAAYISNSHALAVEGVHTLLDSVAVVLALLAAFTTRMTTNSRASFGYIRAEVLAALVTVAGLFMLAVGICYSAVKTLIDGGHEVVGPVVIYTALGSMATNILISFVLYPSNDPSASVRAVWNHALSDCMENFCVLIAAVFITMKPTLTWIDPTLSFLIVILIIAMNSPLFGSVLRVIMQMAPRSLDVDGVRDKLAAINGVLAVRDLHIWSIAAGELFASVRLGVRASADRDVVTHEASAILMTCGASVETCVQVDAVTDA